MLTYKKAKHEAELLLYYVDLIDRYKIESLDDLIIYQYAHHNSISKIIKNIRLNDISLPFEIDQELITTDYVRESILSKPQNELHSIIKSGYLKKTRPRRRRN